MFGESSAIYPYAVIHLLVPTMLRWNIVSTKLSEFELAPKKSQFLPAPRNMNIWKVFAPRVNFQRWKKKRILHTRLFPYRRDRYSRATSWRCVWCTPFGSRWTIVSAKGNGRWWRLTIIFMRYRTLSYVRSKECRGNISILSLSLPPFPSLYIKIIVYFPSSIPIYY